MEEVCMVLQYAEYSNLLLIYIKHNTDIYYILQIYF